MHVDEPVLPVDDLQGDVVEGFRKDHARLVFLQINPKQINEFRRWVRSFSTQIASAAQVGGFNTVRRQMRRSLGREPFEISVLWRNIAFTSAGLAKIIGQAEVDKLADTSFKSGAAALSSSIGDPTDGSAGDPRTWLIGAGANTPDVLFIIAADNPQQLETELATLLGAISPFSAQAPYVEVGNTLATDVGHEHFGYKDGISQPGIRGTTAARTYITPRFLDETDPNAPYLAAPGQPLIWPGEVLLNQPKQKGANSNPLQFRTDDDGPAWATNGSYLVFRRLRQNVALFNEQVAALHGALAADPAFSALDIERAGAMLVGRFKSGCPLMRSSTDDTAIAADVYASNNFLFSIDSPALRIIPNSTVPPDRFPLAHADGSGERCPLGAHIRKVNPRDEATDLGSGYNNLQRRLLRRGIPYGPPFDPAAPDNQDRGLLFLAYQSSIVDQFEVLMSDWVNHTDHPRDEAGLDPLISQRPDRAFNVRRPDGTALTIPLGAPVVTATGSAYLFAPSISTLRDIIGAK